MKGKTVLVLAISFAFILGTMLAGADGVFAAKDGEKKTENKEKKEKKVIVLYKSDKADKKDEKGKKHKDKEKHVEKLKGKNAKIKYVYDIIPGIAATIDEDSIADLMNDEDVLAVIEDVEVHTTLQDSIPQINADDVHATGITGKNVKVCIVDTGVDDSDPNVLNPLIAEIDFVNNDSDATDDNFHGTHVAGIVASIDPTYKGVAPGASLMAAKVLGSTGSGSSSDVVMGIEWCVANGADVISMSLGAARYVGTCDSTVLAIASNNAVADGVVVIASSGNDGDTKRIKSPSCGSDVISVGAVLKNDVRAGFSNGGRELDIAAPGVSIKSLNLAGSGYRTLSGTSMSAPHVSGTAALLLESNSELTPDAIRKILRSTSVDLGSSGFDNLYGYGRINANEALAANANLFVSAENSWGDNYMSGPQVIEVIVIDSDISDTNEGKGEPDVTVNGKVLRMVQAVGGNWYGYFADKKMAEIADATSVAAGEGLDFGTFCDPSVTIGGSITGSGVSFAQTAGVAFPLAAGAGGGSTENTVPDFGACDANISGVTTVPNNVVREAKEPNPNFIDPNPAVDDPIGAGQIDIDVNAWPFIQLYTLNPTGSVVINYNKGGGTQKTVLTFDTVDHLVGMELDRAIYPPLAQVRATISDLWLNIDPTDEDSWTFGTNPIGGLSTNYQVFDENGFAVGDTPTNTDSNLLTAALPNLMCGDNCVLIIDPNAQDGPNPVLTLSDNADSEILGTNPNDPLSFRTSGGNLDGKMPVTLTELTPNSGVFGTYDEQDNSILKISVNAEGETTAAINYNDTELLISVTDITVVQINDGGNENYAEADASEDGTMWVFYENQPCCSSENENAIYFQKSLAGEENPEILIVDNPNVSTPELTGIHAFDNGVHVTWIENTGTQPGLDDDLWIRTSTDGGDTFGPAVKILDGTYDHGNNGVSIDSKIGQIMKQSETDGDLFMFTYDRRSAHAVYKSTDNGATWTFQSIIPGFDGETGAERTKYPALSHNGIRVVGDTIHVAVGASDAFFSEYRIFYNRSDDDGVNWITDNETQVKRISDYDISIDEDEAELHINGNKLIAIWMVYEPAELFQYNTSLDGGDTWGTPQTMDICGDWYGQPQVDWASAQNGDNVAFVCAGNTSSMAFSDDFGTTWDVNLVPSSKVRKISSAVSENGDMAFTWIDTSTNSVKLFYAEAPISNGFDDFTLIEVLTSDAALCAKRDETPEINFVPNSGMFVTYCTPDPFTMYFAYAELHNIPTEEFFNLSKNSDSSDVREFETSDTMHILIFSPIVDTDNMKKAEFKIQDSKKVKLQGKLTLGADGVYSASVSLADLNAGTAKVELKLEDNTKKKFHVKENIIISGDPGSEPPTEEFFFISKNSDFSTDDREYTTSDTVFMKVFTDKEFATIKKTEYKIKMEDKTEVKGVLDDNGDGTFTASTDLLAFIGHEGIPKEFKLKVEGKDSGGGKLKVEFKLKITITS